MSDCEIEIGANFRGKEICVEEEERMGEGKKTGHL
jgi:hypothetical protein